VVLIHSECVMIFRFTNLVFAAMLTGPRINAYFYLFHMIYFLLQRRKYIQYCTILYVQCMAINVWAPEFKKSYLGWWPWVQGCKLSSTPVPCCKSTAHFPKAAGPPPAPSPDSAPQAHITHVIQFQNCRKTTSTRQKSS
jgi:hypothetical protein